MDTPQEVNPDDANLPVMYRQSDKLAQPTYRQPHAYPDPVEMAENLFTPGFSMQSGSRWLRATNQRLMIFNDPNPDWLHMGLPAYWQTSFADEFCRPRDFRGQVICLHSTNSAHCPGKFEVISNFKLVIYRPHRMLNNPSQLSQLAN